jgi:hypothetical protein
MTHARAIPRNQIRNRKRRGPMPPWVRIWFTVMVVNFGNLAWDVYDIARGYHVPLRIFLVLFVSGGIYIGWPAFIREFKRWWNSGD